MTAQKEKIQGCLLWAAHDTFKTSLSSPNGNSAEIIAETMLKTHSWQE